MEKRKQIVNSILFLGILFIIICLITKWFVPKDNNALKGMIDARANGVLGEEKNTIDVLVIGDSESFTSISPLPIWDKYGFTMFNGGVSSQYLVDTLKYLEMVLEYQSPKIVLLEANAIYRKMDFDNVISSLASDIAPLLKYHNRWKTMDGRDFIDKVKYTNTDEMKGFWYKKTIVPPLSTDGYMSYDNRREEISSLNKYYLEKIVNVCNNNGIKLILYSTPSVKNWNYQRHNAVLDFANNKNITYLDLNLEVDKLGIDWDIDSRDAGDHLNYYGAIKITDYMGDYLNSLNILKSHKNDKKYDSWNKAYQRYLEKIQV